MVHSICEELIMCFTCLSYFIFTTTLWNEPIIHTLQMIICSISHNELKIDPESNVVWFQTAQVVKNLSFNAGVIGDVGLIPRLGRSPGVGNGDPLKPSCLENPMDRGAWQVIVQGVTKSRTQLGTQTFWVYHSASVSRVWSMGLGKPDGTQGGAGKWENWRDCHDICDIEILLVVNFREVRCCCCIASVVFDSVRPHRRQPTRLPCPWDSPGKSTGVGCHFLLQCMKVKSESEVFQSCLAQWPHGLQPTRLLHPWNFPGKSTGVGCHCLLR